VRRIQEISRRHHLPIAAFGHIGDGNLHPNILFDARLPDEVERCHRAARDILAAAVELGGTLSGEHGIGLIKKDLLGMAVEPAALALMRGIKAAFDPHGILNPDKIFPGPGPK
jgi:glycolate oxidase